MTKKTKPTKKRTTIVIPHKRADGKPCTRNGCSPRQHFPL
jgi:hypothetical protein